jgi:hypothetical protein
MSTALVSQNGLGLKNTVAVDAYVESVGSLNDQAGFVDSHHGAMRGKQDIDVEH